MRTTNSWDEGVRGLSQCHAALLKSKRNRAFWNSLATLCGGFVDWPRHSYEHSNASFQLLSYIFTMSRVSNILSHHKYRKKVKPELNYVVEKTNTKAANTNTINEWQLSLTLEARITFLHCRITTIIGPTLYCVVQCEMNERTVLHCTLYFYNRTIEMTSNTGAYRVQRTPPKMHNHQCTAPIVRSAL